MNYYPFHLGDYAAHTAHLEPMEDLAYRRMLDLYYRTEQPLPDEVDQIARLIRLKGFEREIMAVLAEFFNADNAGWTHGRCEAEISRMKDKQAKARASAQVSVNARSANAQRTLSERSANAELPTPTPTPTPKKDKDIGPAPSASPEPPPPFDGLNAESLNGKALVPLASTWDLPEQWGVDAEALGWKPSEVLYQAEKFRQYWTAGRGAGTRRSVKGWRQTWSTWLDKAAKDKR